LLPQPRRTQITKLLDYPFEIRPLTDDEGGGYLISFIDFDECIADGTTPQEAIRNGKEALKETIAAMQAEGLQVPQPGEGQASGRFVIRLPKSLHSNLVQRAKREGVSMNMLVTMLLAQGVSQSAHK